MTKATGIGPALRKARLLRGKSIEEASRETRIRPEYLQALERERFESLLGDVYVRGFLRSYSSYLGLDSDKVVSIYTLHFGSALQAPATPSWQLPPGRRASARPRRWRRRRWQPPTLRGRGLNWPVLVVVAVVVAIILAVAGLFSPSRTAPAPAGSQNPALGIAGLVPGVTVVVEATVDVRTTITADGRGVFDDVLLAGEGRSFSGQHSVKVVLARGASAIVIVNGHTIGSPGSSKEPYEATFGPNAFRSQPSAAPSVR